MPPVQPNNPRGPKIAAPAEFDGSKDKVTTFLKDCKLYMMARPEMFTYEDARIAFILSYCKGPKIDDWANMVFEDILAGRLAAPATGNSLMLRIKTQFGDPHEAMTAQMKLDRLTQTGSVDDYIISFRTLAQKTGYDEIALTHKFIENLHKEVRRKCFSVYPMPDTLEEWYTIAQGFQRAWEFEKSFQYGQNTSIPRPTGTSSKSQVVVTKNTQTSNTSSGGRVFGGSGQPMDIDRKRIQCAYCKTFGHTVGDCRRAKGECLRCGKKGHMIKDCKETVARVREMDRDHQEQEMRYMEEIIKKDKEVQDVSGIVEQDFVLPQ
jgi:hypothetical protein